MNTRTPLLSIIADIYDSAFDETLWREVLQRIVDHTGARSAALTARRSTGEIHVGHSVGLSPDFEKTYIERYGQLSPMKGIGPFGDPGLIYTTEDWLPFEEFRKSMFYQEWARPQRLEDGVNIVLNKSAEGFCHFSLMRSVLVDDDLRATLAWLVPHLQRRARIGELLSQRARIAGPIEELLDQLKPAVFLLDGAGNITHANQSGRDLLYREDFLRAERGHLVATDPKLNRVLRDAVAASVLGDGATRSESIVLPFIAHDGERLVGHFLPLSAGRRREIGATFEATAMLLVKRTSLDAPAAADVIKRVFKLTPAELRVMLAVVEHGGVPDTARNLNVAESTVKTHLARIFAKTDTKRQAELVKLTAAFSSQVKS
jgi:DNA-binding CsgD family transcriptional regulator/PAS domain-containing protein